MKSEVTAIEDQQFVEAEKALSVGDWVTAAELYETLVRKHPRQAEAKLKLARAYEELNRLQDVIDLLAGPESQDDHKAKRILAKTYLRVKDYDAAKPLIDELLAASPEDLKLVKWHALCIEQASTDELAEKMRAGQLLFSTRQFEQAEEAYLKVLEEHPDTARAHFRLGQIYSLQQRWADAIAPLRAGLALEPANVKIRKSLAQAFFKDGRPAEAVALLESSDSGEHDPDILFLLQRCHMRLGNWLHVEELGERLLSVLPVEDPLREVVSNIRQDAAVETETASIDAVAEAGDLERAILQYADIADRHPKSALAWLKLGAALADAQRDDEAMTALRCASGLRPGDMRIRKALTAIITRTSEESDILNYVRDAIDAGTADFECHRWLAQYHNKRHDWQSAFDSARNALSINPQHTSARLLLARSLMRLSRLAEALDELNILLTTGAKSAEVLELKADIFVRLGRLDDAIDLYRRALRADPNRPILNHRLSYAFLLKGDIEGFHRHHERRRETSTFIANNPDYPFLDWNGELVIDGKLLVWSEAGLGVGQNILHMTFLKPLVSLGLDVVFSVEPRLVELCSRSFPDIRVVANDAELPEGISHHTPIGSLSRWFKPDLQSFDLLGPYFLPDADAVIAHRRRLQQAAGGGQLLVGISWTSNNPFVGDVKSVELEQLLNAISLPNVTLVNLQYGDHSQSIALAQEATGKRLMDSGIDNSNDLNGLAAVVGALDLVVCIGHTTAHMAGAVGVPNFVLLPAGPFAHWLAEGEKCIWYPASRLFRQAPIDDGWAVVLRQVRKAIDEFTNDYDPETWLAGTLLPASQPESADAKPMPPQETRDAIRAFAAQGAYRSALELLARLKSDELPPEFEMLRGEMLALIGRWDEARAVYVGLRQPDFVDHDLEKKILSVTLDMHDLTSALPLAHSLAEQDPGYRMTLATILYRLRRHDEALAELRTTSLQAPQIEGLSALLGTILLETRALDRAERYLTTQAAVNRRPEDYTLLGRSISEQGRREEAVTVFEAGLALVRRKPEPAGHFWRTQDRIALGLVDLNPLPPLLGRFPEAGPDDLVVFFGADSTYFWQHGLVLLGSLARNSPSAKCHVHIVNPDEGIAGAIMALGGLLPDLKLSYSYENIDFGECSEDHIRTYYASVRFVRLAEIFAQRPATYLCLDTDGIVRGDINACGHASGIGDVGIRMRFDERPQLGMVASASMLKPTPGAMKFINRASAMIKSTLEAGEAVWFLDQVVLNHVLRELGGEVAVSQLSMTYLDWFFHDESLIWTGKGARKSDDNRYIEEVSKYRYLQEAAQIADLMPRIVEGDEQAKVD